MAPLSARANFDFLETILATFPLEFEPGFDTPEEAIAFSERIAAERGNFALCVGRVIRAADWRDDAIVLQLDNGRRSTLDAPDMSSTLPLRTACPATARARCKDRMPYWSD